MKKLFLIVLLSGVSIAMLAIPRTPDQAMNEAEMFLNKGTRKMAQRRSAMPLRLVHTAFQPVSKQPAYYVFNQGSEQGFVIVSADDCVESVIGYADSGSFVFDSMPDNVAYWMNRYAEQVESAVAKGKKLAMDESIYTAVLPLVKTQWNQSSPYNNMCPMDGRYRSVTGCTVTAYAQIMKYYQCPTTGTGSHSYAWNGGNSGKTQTLSADFSQTVYQWSSMLNTYTKEATTKQENAVATLMYHCGVASEMNYSSSGSGASTLKMSRALYSYFGYDPSMQNLPYDYMTRSTFLGYIQQELLEKRPLIMEGYSSDGGHCFICDGIDENGRIHINWGWGGLDDGYFRVSCLDPTNQGIGGSASDDAYTEYVNVVRGIRPYQSEETRPTITAESVVLSKTSFTKTSVPSITVTKLCNRGIFDWTGNLCLVFYQNGVEKAVSIGSYYNLSPLYYYDSVGMKPSFSSLGSGTYDAVLSVMAEVQDTYYPLFVRGIGEQHYTVVVDGNNVTMTPVIPEPEEPEEEILIQRSCPYNYTDLYAIYYPTENTSSYQTWYIQLRTNDFWNQGDNEALLRLGIRTNSSSSIVGTYLPFSTMQPTCLFYAALYEGNIENYVFSQLSISELTIVSDDGQNYTVYVAYRYKDYMDCDTIHLTSKHVSVWDHDTSQKITLNLTSTSALSISQLYDYTQSWKDDRLSYIPYLVEGEVAAVESTVDQIRSSGYANMTMRDNSLNVQVSHLSWLKNEPFVTGKELKANDHVCCLSQFKHHTTVADTLMNGYVYSYQKMPNCALVNIYVPSESVFENSLYIWWWLPEQQGQCVSATYVGDNWYVASIPSDNMPFQCLVVNKDVSSGDWSAVTQTYDSEIIYGGECLVIGNNMGTKYAIGLADCEHVFNESTTPTNLQAQTVYGSVTLSWDCSYGSLWTLAIVSKNSQEIAYYSLEKDKEIKLSCTSTEEYIWFVRTMLNDSVPLSEYQSGTFQCSNNPYQLHDLQTMTTDGTHYTFSWQIDRQPENFILVVLFGEDEYYSVDTIQTCSAVVNLQQKGIYSWFVIAIDENDEWLNYKFGDDITITAVPDYSISDLSVVKDGLKAKFSWNSLASAFMIYVLSADGKYTIMSDICVEHSWTASMSEGGQYIFFVCPINDALMVVLGDWEYLNFIISDDATRLQQLEKESKLPDKFIRGNQLIIRNGDKEYNASGMVLNKDRHSL